MENEGKRWKKGEEVNQRKKEEKRVKQMVKEGSRWKKGEQEGNRVEKR